jgi:hypothetical protein
MMKSAGRSATAPAPSPLAIADALGIALLAAGLLAVGYLRSRHRMFWGDEIMGALTLGQPTWSGVLKFWHAGIDSSGIWYYVFVRPWVALFGIGELSLRLFSAVGIALSAAIIWITARRFYSILPVAASVAFVYSSTSALRWQLSNGRTYGVFMAASALVLYLIFRGEDESNRRPSLLFLLASFAAYTLLAGSHILGALYVGGFLGIQLLLDLAARRFRPTLYLAALCSFAVVLFSRVNLQATAALGKPSFWTLRPALRYLVQFTIVTDPRVHLVLFALLLLAFFSFRFRPQRMTVYVVLVGFLGLNLLMFEISRHATSIYVDRYLMPFAFALTLLMCEAFTQLREADLRFPTLRSALPVAVLLLALWNARHPDIYHVPPLPYPDYTTGLLQSLPPGLPVVDTDAASFVELHYYHPDGLGHALLYPTDWPIALDPANTGGVSGFHEMDNFKAVGIYADSIQPADQILSQNRDFIVLVNRTHPTVWVDRRILGNPRYQVTYRMLFKNDMNVFDVWQVHTL